MPTRGSPNGPAHTPPQPGRDRPEWVVAINRNAWSQSVGTGGRNHPVRAVWSRCSISLGISLQAWLTVPAAKRAEALAVKGALIKAANIPPQ